jgi:hypothetical protein
LVAKNRILGTVIGLALVLAFVAPQVSAGPYMGGYLKRSVTTSSSVLLDVDWQETDVSEIPSGKWLMGVVSVAGADGVAPSGWVYQNPVALISDNDVYWAPQAWYGDERGEYDERLVGDGDYVAFYERIDIGSDTVCYRLYAYPDLSHFDNDDPYTYVWSHLTDDGNFLIGNRYHWWNGTNYMIKHFQFGVESNYAITNTAWEELNNNPCYYDGRDWRYSEGRVCNGTSAAITWNETGVPFGIGGLDYTGVNTTYTSSDEVCWTYSGQTIGDDELLWSGNGTVGDAVSAPYEPAIAGVTGEVRCDILPGVSVELWEDDILQSSTTSDEEGKYEIVAVDLGIYNVVASKEGFRDETHAVQIGERGQELNFRGETGLVPNAPDMSYVLLCVHYWQHPTGECALSMSKVLSVVHAWQYPINGKGGTGVVLLDWEVDAVRDMPSEVQRGQTFPVAVTFTACEDEFNAIGLTDLAPEGWDVSVDSTWCTPRANAVKGTDNKAEIAWFGPYDRDTAFTAVYNVTVPQDAPLGVYEFGDGFLKYYVASAGPYTASIGGDSEIEVVA